MASAFLVRTGCALYGERWQTALANDLNVADRTLRRWVAGVSPIPEGVEQQLRKLLIDRLDQIGGMIGYCVNPNSRTVLHYPTGAYFVYDAEENVELLNLNQLTIDVAEIALLKEGVVEAVRRERERDERIQFSWGRSIGGATR